MGRSHTDVDVFVETLHSRNQAYGTLMKQLKEAKAEHNAELASARKEAEQLRTKNASLEVSSTMLRLWQGWQIPGQSIAHETASVILYIFSFQLRQLA